MIKSNFLKKVHTSAKFLTNFNNFQAKLDSLKNWHPYTFSKTYIATISIPAIISHPHFLMSFNHLSSTVVQNKTIIVWLLKMNMPVCVFDNSKIMLKMVTVSFTLTWHQHNVLPLEITEYESTLSKSENFTSMIPFFPKKNSDNFWTLPNTFRFMTAQHSRRCLKIFFGILKVAESSSEKPQILEPSSFSLLFRTWHLAPFIQVILWSTMLLVTASVRIGICREIFCSLIYVTAVITTL